LRRSGKGRVWSLRSRFVGVLADDGETLPLLRTVWDLAIPGVILVRVTVRRFG